MGLGRGLLEPGADSGEEEGGAAKDPDEVHRGKRVRFGVSFLPRARSPLRTHSTFPYPTSTVRPIVPILPGHWRSVLAVTSNETRMRALTSGRRMGTVARSVVGEEV